MKSHKQNHFFLLVMMTVSLMLASMASKAAEGSLEVTCRAKAKEVALDAYKGCVSEARSAQLSEIRDGYKNELAAVKAKYEGKLKEMGGETVVASTPAPKASKAVKTAKAAPVVASRPGRAERPASGIARKLPAKQNDNGPALPVQTVSDDQAVVTASSSGTEDNTVPAPEVMDSSAANDTGF